MDDGIFQFLFKSVPLKSQRKLPQITPSIFIIGTHFITKFSSKYFEC